VKQVLTPELHWKMTRRRFLIGTGSLGVLGLGAWFGIQEGRPALMDWVEDNGGGRPKLPDHPNIWFEIAPSGPVKFFAPKLEMGQGIHSALAQIAAEELEVGWDQITTHQADNTRGFEAEAMFTFGSTSVNRLFKPICEAAAMLREMLRLEAATQLQVPLAEVVALRGACFARQNVKRKLTYGQIVVAKTGEWIAPKSAPALKPRRSYSSVGQNMPRVDVRAKLLGQPVYGFDVRLPGMLYGAVAHPPRFGAKLESGNVGNLERIPGVKKIVIDPAQNFAGVAASTRMIAQSVLKKLEQTLVWRGGSSINQAELEAMVTARPGDGVIVRKRGNASASHRRNNWAGDWIGSWTGSMLEATYRTPMAAHACLEPLSATVRIQDKLIEAWVATQSISMQSKALEPYQQDRELRIYPMQMGGSFGRKGGQTCVGEAARLSSETGKPVHVGWTRKDEMRHSFYRPPTQTFMRGSLSPDGKIRAIEHVVTSGDSIFPTTAIPEFIKEAIGLDFGVQSGLFAPYAIPNYEVRSHRVVLPVPTGPWRGVGVFPNVFATESFIDELAHAAKQDPLEFRLAHVPDTAAGVRMRRVLEDLRERSDWKTPIAPGRARGVAFCIDKGAHVGLVAEVSSTKQEIVIERVTVSVDAGLVINPVNAGLQAKGSVIMGIGSTLSEKITVTNGRVDQENFKTLEGSSAPAYPLFTLKQTPRDINVHFIASEEEPQGMGEPVIGPVGAAIANALFTLTGQRQRELPLKTKA
jgi:isoquinoline 1-oxidoreductase subunit beta